MQSFMEESHEVCQGVYARNDVPHFASSKQRLEYADLRRATHQHSAGFPIELPLSHGCTCCYVSGTFMFVFAGLGLVGTSMEYDSQSDRNGESIWSAVFATGS